MEYIKIGKIVNTHGIKGEIRIISDFKYKDKVFIKNFNVYIGNKYLNYVINSYRKHKQFDMITLEGINNINEVLTLKNKDIFINKEDLSLNKEEYINEELIGLKVYIDNKIIGEIIDIINNSTQELLVIKNNEKKILIPYVSDIIEQVDIVNNKIIITDIKGLI